MHRAVHDRGIALLKGVADIEGIVLRREGNGTPILVRDVASVAVAPLTRQGAVTRNGRGEVVIGMVMMLYGENSREVVQRALERGATHIAQCPGASGVLRGKADGSFSAAAQIEARQQSGKM